MERHRVLVIDDDADVLLALTLLLKENGYAVTADSDPKKIASLMKSARFDAVLLDMNFTKEQTDGREGFYWLKEIRETDPEVMVVPITAFGDLDLAVKAIREGAADFILKPWKNEKLLSTLAMALELRASKLQVKQLQFQRRQLVSDMDLRFAGMIGESRAMKEVFATIVKVAATDASILVMGENGTGKELVARALHRGSRRAESVFICVDMGCLAETLFESELFGHVKGAFTDARENRIGRFETASGGTLFLDEIGNLSLPMQAKLLRAIESGEITPVGSNRPRPVDVRLICATNMPLHEMVSRKEFRQDLLYRINTIEIKLPPLRERKEDIPALVEYYSSIYCGKYKVRKKKIAPQTMTGLMEYPWPGNIRELKHAIERAVIMSDSEALRPQDFLVGGQGSGGEASAPSAPGGSGLDGRDLESMEKEAVRQSLIRYGGNISRAAKALGLTRASLYRRIRKHGLGKLQA
jgi:two-component system response regulator HydG